MIPGKNAQITYQVNIQISMSTSTPKHPQALLADACYLLLPVAHSTLYAQGCTPAPQPR